MNSVKLDCQNIWKLYGPKADEFLDHHNETVDDSTLTEAGIIGAVCDANVQIRAGEIFVIMGLSGSGKSTLIRCLSRLIEPTSGKIKFEGQYLTSMTESELVQLRRQKMGMVFQHFALLPHLTVLQNVTFPLAVQGVSQVECERRANEMISLVGLDGRESYFPRELSGGQQQRVGIARSLVTEPELWFLDEPFSALDPLIRREMQDEFLRLQSMLQKTILFITHDFDEAIRLADRIAVMKDGRIVQTATPEHLTLFPENSYVEEFTRYVPRAKVVRLGTITTIGDFTGPVAGSLPHDLTVAETAEQIEASELPYLVLGKSGEPIGKVNRNDVIDILLGRSQ